MRLSEAESMLPSKLGGIYAIHCEDADRVYVGQASNLRNRARQHFQSLLRGDHKNPALRAIAEKHGTSQFRLRLLEIIPAPTRASLCDAENRWMEFYRSLGLRLYNCWPAAESPLGYEHSAEFKEQIRARQLGKTASPETRRKMALRRLGNQYSTGYKHTEATLAKRKLARTGLKLKEYERPNSRREYDFISPDGIEVHVLGLERFCLANGLWMSAMHRIHVGTQKQHKGWTKGVSNALVRGD